MVPSAGECVLFGMEAGGSFTKKGTVSFPVLDDDRKPSMRRTTRTLNIGPGGASIEKEHPVPLAEGWDPAEGPPPSTFLSAERWIRRPFLGDADGDGRRDLLCLGPDGSELRIHRQGKDGAFSKGPDWTGRFEGVKALLPEDLDGDRRIDLAAVGSKGDDETDIRFFLNRDGTFRPEAPDEILKFSGYAVTPHLADLDGDGRVELAVSSFSLSAEDLLKGGKVVRALVIFGRDPEGLFGRRPAFRVDEPFSAAEVKGLAQPVNFGADLFGGGARQALHLDREGAVVARRFDRSLRLEGEPSWRFVASRAVIGIDALSLNGDGRSDLILRHVRSVTVLVSR
jgi:hypothetical protein